MYNGPTAPMMVYHRTFGMCRVNVRIEEPPCRAFVDAVVAKAGALFSRAHPTFDGSLEDGSRLHAVVPPASQRHLTFNVRKFSRRAITVADLVRTGTLPVHAAAFLWCCVDGLGHSPANLLIVGATSSGKTTSLNAFTLFVPQTQRLVVIEDTKELQLFHPNTAGLLAGDEVGMGELLVGSLRMRPDRIIVGEVRGAEAETLLGAMNTGHHGCMGTLHANSARETIHRITSPPMSVPLTQTTGLDLIIVQELQQEASGPRRVVTEIAEVCGVGEGVVRMNQLFLWHPREGRLVSTGIPSRFRSRLCLAADLSAEVFQSRLRRRAEVLERLAQDRVSATVFVDAVTAEARFG